MTRSLLNFAAWFACVAVLLAMLAVAAFVAVINWIFADHEGDKQ